MTHGWGFETLSYQCNLNRMTSDLSTYFPLRKARVHEVCGSGSLSFSAIVAAQACDCVFWIREAWRPEILNPVGLSDFFDPSKLLIAQVKDQTEGLAVMEEALRDGNLSHVVMELGEPLGLTEGRRLQLAAKAGKTIGLCRIPEGMGSNVAETRWHCTPILDRDDSTLQRWELIKNKSGTLGAWHVRWNTASRSLHMASPVTE
ncbi:ImuA family protein [Litoreibacter meonggei]